MSELKTPKKAELVSKPNENPKTETPKTETKSVDNVASKSVSAAQLSTSHFSSVSTPQYRSGWNTIFGNRNEIKTTISTQVTQNDLPKKLNIVDYDIDLTLRAALDAAFNNLAQKRGIKLKDTSEFVRFEYNLNCEIIKK